MRGLVPDFEIKKVKNLPEAFALLEAASPWQPFAGGTDLMVQFEAGLLKNKKYFDILGISEFQGIKINNEDIFIGAAVTYTEIIENQIIQKEFPLLIAAAKETGAVAIQNRGTLGGNIANASPAADTPPALLAYDAEIEMISSKENRRLPYVQFHKGYKLTDLKPTELISGVRLKRDFSRYQQMYRKVGTRKSQAISKVCFAGIMNSQKNVVADVKLGIGSVAPAPLRAQKTEQFLIGKTLNNSVIETAIKVFEQEIAPISDIRSTRDYRLFVAKNLLREFLANG